MTDRARGDQGRGRKRGAWGLYAVALVAMTVGLFQPSYLENAGHQFGVSDAYPGWECAWTVTWIWGNVIENGFAGLEYGNSLMLSYLPINALFVIAGWFLWLAGRTRRVAWVFRVVYTLIVLQVLAWWGLHALESEQHDILIGYWFWLAAYVLLAAAFWLMPRVESRTAGSSPALPDGEAPQGAGSSGSP